MGVRVCVEGLGTGEGGGGGTAFCRCCKCGANRSSTSQRIIEISSARRGDSGLHAVNRN